MASNSDENDQSSIGKQCLELSKTKLDEGLSFEFSIKIGPSFSFWLDSSGNPAQAPTVRYQKKSPSEIKRKNRRRLQLLKREETTTASTNISTSVFDASSTADSEAAAASQIETLQSDEKRSPLKMKIKRSVDGEWISYFTSARVPPPTSSFADSRAAATSRIETLNTDEKKSRLKVKIERSV